MHPAICILVAVSVTLTAVKSSDVSCYSQTSILCGGWGYQILKEKPRITEVRVVWRSTQAPVSVTQRTYPSIQPLVSVTQRTDRFIHSNFGFHPQPPDSALSPTDLVHTRKNDWESNDNCTYCSQATNSVLQCYTFI